MAVKTTRAPVRETASKAPKKQLAGKPAEPTKAGADARKRAAKPTAAKPLAKKQKPVEKPRAPAEKRETASRAPAGKKPCAPAGKRKRVEITAPAVPASGASALAAAYAVRAKSETAQGEARAKTPRVKKIEPVARVVEDVVPVPPVARAVEPVVSVPPAKPAAKARSRAKPAPEPAVSVSAPARTVEAREPASEPVVQTSTPRRHLTLVQPAFGAGERDSAGVVRTERGVGAREPGSAEFDASSVDLAALLGSGTAGGEQAAITRVSGVRTAAPVASAQVAAPVVLPVESEARRDAYESVLKRLDESEVYERNNTPSLLRTRVFAGISLSGAGLAVAALTPLINGGWAVLSVVAGAIAFYTAGENFFGLRDDRKRSLSNQAPSSVSYAVVKKAVEVARVNGLPFEAQTYESKIDIVFNVLRKLVEEHKPKDVFAFIASNERVVVEALRSRIERDKLQYIEQHLIPDCRSSIRDSLRNLVYESGARFLESSRDYLDFVMGELFARVNPGASFADVGSEEKLELLNQVRAYVESPENKRELAELLVRTFKAFCEREITAAELKLKRGQ